MADCDSRVTKQRVFKPYQWQPDGIDDAEVPASTLMDFAEKVQSITSGASVLLQVAEANSLEGELRDEVDPPPYFDPYYTSVMLKLAQTSLDLLRDESERLKEWVHEQKTREGALSRYRMAAYSLKDSPSNLK